MVQIDSYLEFNIILSPVEHANFKVSFLICLIVVIWVKIVWKIDNFIVFVQNNNCKMLIIEEVSGEIPEIEEDLRNLKRFQNIST